VTILASLPDSLQPKVMLLDTLSPPRLIPIQIRPGGSYTVTGPDGSPQHIPLEPPLSKQLPVLLNAKGEPLRDSAGRPFVMGNGGLAGFTTFTSDEGLPLDVINCAFRDHMGNLWFGTRGAGVSRYDGHSFVNFSTAHGFPGLSVLCITEDRRGHLWFGSGAGVTRYDGRTFTTWSRAQGLPADLVCSIHEDKRGNMWFGTDGDGVVRYDGKTFTAYGKAQGLPHLTILSIGEDRSGSLWFGTDGGGLSRYDGHSFTTITKSGGLAGDTVFSVVRDGKGAMWFGTLGGGISRYDGKAFTTFNTTQGLASNGVVSMAVDSSGALWVGTNGAGLSRYDGRTFISYSAAQGLASNHVTCIVQDASGTMWFGTRGGLSRFGGAAFTTISTVQGLGNNIVISIAEDSIGRMWFATLGGGASCYDGRSITSYASAQGLAGNSVFSIGADKEGKLWFGTMGGGVSRYDGRSFLNYSTPQGLAGSTIISIAADRQGALWFGTYGAGLSRFDGRRFTNYSPAQGLGGYTVWSIAEDALGQLWFGTQAGGVSRFDGRSFTTYTTAQGLAGNTVFSITIDKGGNLWFGTDEGLSVLSAAAWKAISSGNAAAPSSPARQDIHQRPGPLFRSFTTANGLPASQITQVLQLPDGRLALGTEAGIALCSPAADLSKLGRVVTYNSATGYPVKEINIGYHCMYADSRGTIWAGTGSEKTALVRFDPAAMERRERNPAVSIRGIRLGEEALSWYALRQGADSVGEQDGKGKISAANGERSPAYITEEALALGRVLTPPGRDSLRTRFSGIRFDSIRPFYPVPEGLVLPYRFNRLSIDFGAIETGRPGALLYRYRLDGYDNDWSPPLKSTSATFGNIREGNYTFRVQAQSPDGSWSAPAAWSFRILPPLYRSWWAYALYALSVLIAILGFSKYRERALRRERDRLERTVVERTAEVVAEKRKSDDLLKNILPEEVAEELKAKGATTARLFDNVTVLFTDFVSFTTASQRMSPQALVDELHSLFRAFDEITGRYGIEKIKTVGDAYLAVAGLPTPDPQHAHNIVRAALEILAFVQHRRTLLGDRTFNIRIGIHSGSAVAGVVGVTKFAYDIWGDTVNTAARMEQTSEPGRINISGATYDLVKDDFPCVYRGKLPAKGKGEIDMYFVG
jgi:ligand-binding sensor domain-containing protein/class 3 adenylate cyclase